METWLLNSLSTSSVVSYSIVLRHTIQSPDISKNKTCEMIHFYLYIAAESYFVQNFIAGRVVKQFEPKPAIEAINEMVKNNNKNNNNKN